MPRPETDGTTTAAVGADGAKLSGMCIENGPYHLVNTNVVLVGTDDKGWRVRGGDSFVLSPLSCGGKATGWVSTSEYMLRDPLTLPTAVAISGAAVNPNTGSGGVGLTRQRGLSLLMALLNIRLGFWVPRPNTGCRQRVANHFRAAWHELWPAATLGEAEAASNQRRRALRELGSLRAGAPPGKGGRLLRRQRRSRI